jgi:hypothetical protein
MKTNLVKVLERDANLTTLETRAGIFNHLKKETFFFQTNNYLFLDVLQTGASQFTANARSLKHKYWWKNVKVILNFHIIDRNN